MSLEYDTTILNRNAVQSINNNAWTRISWDNSELDTPGAANLGVDATKITTPTGYGKVRFTMYSCWANSSAVSRYMSVEKGSNGTQGSGTTVGFVDQAAANESGQYLSTKWLTTVAGDAFECWVLQNSGGALNLSGSAVFGGPSYVMAEFMASRRLVAAQTMAAFSQVATLRRARLAVVAETIPAFSQVANVAHRGMFVASQNINAFSITIPPIITHVDLRAPRTTPLGISKVGGRPRRAS